MPLESKTETVGSSYGAFESPIVFGLGLSRDQPGSGDSRSRSDLDQLAAALVHVNK